MEKEGSTFWARKEGNQNKKAGCMKAGCQFIWGKTNCEARVQNQVEGCQEISSSGKLRPGCQGLSEPKEAKDQANHNLITVSPITAYELLGK